VAVDRLLDALVYKGLTLNSDEKLLPGDVSSVGGSFVNSANRRQVGPGSIIGVVTEWTVLLLARQRRSAIVGPPFQSVKPWSTQTRRRACDASLPMHASNT
jgi:hypothetical protein